MYTRVYTTLYTLGTPATLHPADVTALQHRVDAVLCDGALGSGPEKPVGSPASALSEAQKCHLSYTLCAQMLCSLRVRISKDWIAQGTLKAQELGGGLFAQSLLFSSGRLGGSLRRVLSSSLGGGEALCAEFSLPKGGREASAQSSLFLL